MLALLLEVNYKEEVHMEQINSKYYKMKEIVTNLNLPKYRYEQILKAIFTQRKEQFSEMNALPAMLREALIREFGEHVNSAKPVVSQKSKQSNKLLFELTDGEHIEAIGLFYRKGWESFCISSQCGCGFGCSFCATGTAGLMRNLTADEITDQLLYFYQIGHKLDSVSFMGMGEAFANPHLFDGLALLTDSNLFGLSQRRITVSTIGFIPEIKKLTRSYPQINLAFSLHSPFDEQRSSIMPVNKRYPLQEVMETLDEHIRQTGRKVFLAYIMLHGINDTEEHAKALAELVQKRAVGKQLYHIDLIPYNNTDKTSRNYHATERKKIRNFQDILRMHGIHVTIRTQFGGDIDAACGQLYC
jgi:23S rRNA (adenine-C8)-methyltransferase